MGAGREEQPVEEVPTDDPGIAVSPSHLAFGSHLEDCPPDLRWFTVSFDPWPSDRGRTAVEVEGVEIGQDSSDGWNYDAVDNNIVFHGGAVPEVGENGMSTCPVSG